MKDDAGSHQNVSADSILELLTGGNCVKIDWNSPVTAYLRFSHGEIQMRVETSGRGKVKQDLEVVDKTYLDAIEQAQPSVLTVDCGEVFPDAK